MRFRRSAHEMLEATGDIVIETAAPPIHVLHQKVEVEEVVEEVFVHDAHVGRPVQVGRGSVSKYAMRSASMISCGARWSSLAAMTLSSP